MRNGSKKLIEFVLILFMVSSCLTLTRGEPTEGSKTSGKLINQTFFIDHTGDAHSATMNGDFSAEIVEIDLEKDVFVILEKSSLKRYEILDVNDGGWYKYDYSLYGSMDSAQYRTFDDNGEYEDVLPIDNDPLVGYDGRIHIPFYGDYSVFVADPEAFLEEFKSNAQTMFSTFSPIDWQKNYNDRDGVEKTISGTAQLNDSSIEVKGSRFEMNFQLSEALDRHTFYKGLDNIPTIIDCSYKLILEYEESGLIKFYSYELTYDAGENGKLTRLSSIGGSSAGALFSPGPSWLLGILVIISVIIARKRKSE
jgi:hypothetical protein